MADNTAIEWTDATWNPVRGCTRISEGCRFCYAEGIAARFSAPGAAFHGFAMRDRPGSKWTGKVQIVWPQLDLPLRWTRPRRIFVNSMSDLFHEALASTEIATLFAIMVAARHHRGHTFQILTKRPERMRELLTLDSFWDQVNAEAGAILLDLVDPHARRSTDARATLGEYSPTNPPPGIWLGTSVENQAAARTRIPALRATPAALRFLSCEPLIGPVDLCEALGPWWNDTRPAWKNDTLSAIDWVIAGGESGPAARPMHPDWARALRRQCLAASVPFFFKQWGTWSPASPMTPGVVAVHPTGRVTTPDPDGPPDARLALMARTGKRASGDRLDGRQHHEFPAEPEPAA